MIRKLRDFSSVFERRKFLERERKMQLSALSIYPENLDDAATRNCENMIGAASVPLGVAGPITINGSYGKDSYFLPLATTEGALVASINRGCKVVTQNEGAIVSHLKSGITRGPVFLTGTVEKSSEFRTWLMTNEKNLAREAQATSSHLRFLSMMIQSLAEYIFVRFAFDTQDAMGMNMATIATQKIVEYIEKETGIACVSIAGNFDGDKKPSHLNFIDTRGYQVWAQCILSHKTIESTLKSTADKMYAVWLAKCMYGSIMSGSLGFNAHFANVIAAVFIATGQDPAHVVEGSLGVTTTQITNGGLSVSVYLPSLIVGTVGGGTGLPSQKESLQILGLDGGDQGKHGGQFAEVVGAAVLAGEISLLASLSVGTLAAAHEKFARKK